MYPYTFYFSHKKKSLVIFYCYNMPGGLYVSCGQQAIQFKNPWPLLVWGFTVDSRKEKKRKKKPETKFQV